MSLARTPTCTTTFRSFTRESIESTVMAMMGLVSKDKMRPFHYEVSKRLQPPDMVTQIFVAGNFEQSTMRNPVVATANTGWYKLYSRDEALSSWRLESDDTSVYPAQTSNWRW
ncbi:hypothetical protein LTR27_006494 [Elasticomyces elasticus]|nr:hypothetical protein LTR27_006494 [Elasticomyces elasticus]